MIKRKLPDADYHNTLWGLCARRQGLRFAKRMLPKEEHKNIDRLICGLTFEIDKLLSEREIERD